MFAYPCPFCAQRLLAPPERAGQRTICPKCLKPIVIPRPEAVQEPAAVADLGASAAGHGGDGFILGGPAVDPPAGPSQDTPPPEKRPAEKRPPSRVTVALPAAVPSRAVPPPAPRPAPPRPAEAPARSESGMVLLAPTGVESADAAAELTAALTLRMRPPPEPPGDLKLSTGLWIALTAVGASLLLYSLLYNPAFAAYAAILAAVEFFIGYAWVVYLAGRRGARQGLLTLLPPVAIDRLVRPRTSQGYRPLRFVLSGVVLFSLVLLAPAIRPKVQALAGLDDPAPAPPPPPADPSAAARLRALAADRGDHALIEELRVLTEKKDVLRTVTPPAEKAELVAELRTLSKGDAAEVRTAALMALLAWADDAARPDVLAALSSGSEKERRTALQACGRWKDPETAKAVAARLLVRDDRFYATLALMRIAGDGGQAVVEEALLPLLTEEGDAQPTVRDLTERYGGRRTVDALKKLEAEAGSPSAKDTYRKWWQAVARARGLRG